jgi:23S rRNA U2552 (ribose-2'-O)-methylase RlmE/FtsJ
MFKHESLLNIFNFSGLSEHDITQVFKKTHIRVQTFDPLDLSSEQESAPDKGHILFFDTFTPSDPLLTCANRTSPFSSLEEINKYFLSLICALRAVLTQLRPNGACIIKMFTMSMQLELDVMFILNCLFDKTYVLKPESSHPLISDRYFVCKTFSSNVPKDILESVCQTIEHMKEPHVYIHSLLQLESPYIFLTKIEEINAIIGQQQLDSHVHVVNTIKTKLYEDKHTNIRKNNIYKAVQWCEKNGLPSNKITEKYNAFSNPHFGFCKDKDNKETTRSSF